MISKFIIYMGTKQFLSYLYKNCGDKVTLWHAYCEILPCYLAGDSEGVRTS